MDYEAFERHLVRASEHVIKGDCCVERLRQVIEKRRAGGHDAKEALRLLDCFYGIQASHAQSEGLLIRELRGLIR